MFNLDNEEGSGNFVKLISMIYDPYPHESTRIKLLIFLHYIMLRHSIFCEEFQDSEKQ